VQEEILAKEQARGQHPPDGRDLSVELEEIIGKRAVEVVRLS
jgi:hypothetical protein